MSLRMSKANYFYWKRKNISILMIGDFICLILFQFTFYTSVFISSLVLVQRMQIISATFLKNHTSAYEPALLSCNTYEKSSSSDYLFSNINVILLELLKKYLCLITISSTFLFFSFLGHLHLLWRICWASTCKCFKCYVVFLLVDEMSIVSLKKDWLD